MSKINITSVGVPGSTMKRFAILALSVILFFIFSNLMIDIALKASYNPIKIYKTMPQNVEMEITQSKATYVNGYVGGTIKNNNENQLDTYIKIDLYTKRDVCLGTKYVEIKNLKQEETQDFNMGFKYTDVDYAKVTLVNEINKEVSEEAFKSDNLTGAMLITAVIFLIFFG